MTISSGGLNINFNPTPTIFEKETAGQHDIKNTGDVRGNAVIVPQRDSESVPFTKLEDRNKWDYKSESERPTLTPHTLLRGAGADIRSLDEGKKGQLESLYGQLSDDMKLELAGLPTVYSAALKFVIDLAANALDWQTKAHLNIQTENALSRTAETKKLADSAYSKGLDMGKELIKTLDTWIEHAGANDPGYLDAKDFLADMHELLNRTSHGKLGR